MIKDKKPTNASISVDSTPAPQRKERNQAIICALWLLAVCPLLLCATGCASASGDADGEPELAQGSETRVYEVFGMDCPGCHGGLEKLVMKIPAVQKAQANWQKKLLAVTVKPGAELNDEDIYDAIERANFTPGKSIK